MNKKKILFEHVGGNTFRMAQPQPLGMMAQDEAKEHPTEELAAMWEEDKNGEYVQINDDGSAWYVAHGKAMEQIAPPTSQQTNKFAVGIGKHRSQPVDSSKTFNLIRDWFKKSNISLNIWEVNERGNIELYSPSGKGLGGLV
jgi:hypothetical protein